MIVTGLFVALVFISQGHPDLLTRKPAMLQKATLARLLVIVGQSSRTIFLVPNAAHQLDPINVYLFEVSGNQFISDAALL